MKFASSIICLAALTPAAQAYNIGSSRRQVFGKVAAAVAFAPAAVQAMDACPPKSKNCIRTVWTPPSGTSKKEAADTVKSVISAYPQEGQDKVDLGGWAFAEDDLTGSGKARVEYKSGIGNFAKFLNGGKPFVDDLSLEITDSGAVEVKSASRIGESDFDVNRKRLVYLANGLRAAGWTVPEPSY